MAAKEFVITSLVFVMVCCFSKVYGQQASLTLPTSSVSEASGRAYVCVNITNANSIPAEGAVIQVFVSEDAGINPATEGDDYRLDEPFLTFMPGVESNCTFFTIIQDNLVEGSTDESIIARIKSSDQLISINTQSDLVTISIVDDDRLELGFTQMNYVVQEEFSSFELCVRIENGQISPDLDPIVLETVVSGGTAQGTDDYSINLQDTYVFSNTTSQIDCTPVSIVNDILVEENETITVSLRERNTNLVSYTIQSAVITIEDNDFATVTISPSQLTVVEGNDTLNTTIELCVRLSDVRGGIEREVVVNLATTESTATAMDDFALLRNSLTFQDNARLNDEECFQVLIIGDNFIEVDEVFHVNLSTRFPDLLGDPSTATITISHDGDGFCPTLVDPTNGNVVMNGNTVSSTATYTCNINYALVGSQIRECTADAGWNGEDPLCMRTCEELVIANGNVSVDIGQLVEGAIASYTCNIGYTLSSNRRRLCQSNGQWNGTDATCEEVDCGTLTRPRDGRVVLSGTLPGSTATYTCNDGFELEGTSVATCGSDGEWSGNRPFCSGSSPTSPFGGILLTLSVFFVTLLAHLF